MRLTEGPIHRRLIALWLPMIGGVMSVKAIDVSDAYFVGQLGEDALAAISFTFPVVMTLISLAIGLSAGASSVLSRAIGEDADEDTQREIVSGALAMALLVSLVLSVTGFTLIGPLLRVMGADGQILSDGTTYMRIWFLGAALLVLPVAINGLLRAAGHGTSPALLMALTAVLNIGLNPVFIFGLGPLPGLAMAGAAVATLIARAVSLVAAVELLRRKRLLDVSAEAVAAGLKRWREVARVGLPASLSTSLNPMAMGVATAAVATLGSAQVAAFGLASKIQEFALVPILALSSASPPLVGQNSSAGEHERSRLALYWCAGISLAWSLIVTGVLLFAARPLAGLFSDTQTVIGYAARYLTIVPISFVGYGITIALSAAMNGLGRSATSLAISGGRAMGLLAPAAWIGVLVGGFTGVAVGVLVANLLSGIVALIVMRTHGLTVRGS